MKKVLFASTALVAFAGAAAADVELSGRAEMGIADTNAEGVSTQFFSDIDVTFTMSGETDGGLTFGASIDLDESADQPGIDADADGALDGVGGNPAFDNNADDGGLTIFVSGSFGTVTMGDTDGALDWALTDAGNINNGGSLADDETTHLGYFGAYHDGAAGQDGQILRYDYTAGAFGFALSYEQGDLDLGSDGTTPVVDETDGFGLGLKYSLELSGVDVDLGLGYQTINVAAADDIDIIGVSATANFANGFGAGLTYVDGDVTGIPDSDHVGIGVGYTTGALTLHANYGKFDFGDGTEADGYGLSVAYDLGGGAVVHFGYGDSEATDAAGVVTADKETVSLGLGLSF